MHAIVRLGSGKYYISAVFGYYHDVTVTEGCEGDHQSFSKPYWIVWDEKRERLIRWQSMTPNIKSLIPQILIVDSSRDGWNVDKDGEDGEGCVDFLSRELLDSVLDEEVQPADILEKCRLMDSGYVYDATPEIRTQKDIEDLEWVSGCFHDAFIAKEEMLDDGTLHVLFDGTWGCKIEVWFWGDVEYDTSSRNPETSDPYWLDSTIILQDGFVYLVDDCEMTADQISDGNCYFKARHMKYRVVPD